MSHSEARAAIYLFHDPQGRVDSYVLTALASLRPFVQQILLVSNGPLQPSSRQALAAVTDDVLERENTGLDVGGYQAGLAHLGWEHIATLDELLLLNHTFFAPVRPWEPVFEAATARPEASFWGLTEHNEQRPHPFLAQASMPRHLQSHFLAIRASLLRDPAFREYWETMPPIHSYHDSIAHHESRFTPHFNALGHGSFAVFPLSKFHSLNPSLEEAMALLEAGCPALKRRIFFHDPLYLDTRGIRGAELLRAAATPELTEDDMLAGLVRTSDPRALLATAGLTELVRTPVLLADSSEPPARLHSSSPTVALLDAEPSVRIVLTVPEGEGGTTTDPRAYAVAKHHGLDLALCPTSTPGAGPLTSLLGCGADLLDEEGLLLLPGSAGDADLLASDETAFASARRLFAEHPGLGVVGQVAPVRGNTALGHGLHDASVAEAMTELSHDLKLSAPLDRHSPVWSYGGSLLLRGEALTGLRELGVEELVATYGAARTERLLELLLIPAALSAGWHYRQLFGPRAAEDYALLEYRYQGLAALLPEDPEEAQRYLAARAGENAGLGSMLRRELEHRAPGVAGRMTPAYRRITGMVSKVRRTR